MINCPECHLECDNLCQYRQGDMCNALSRYEPVSIFTLMSHEELIEYPNKQTPPEWSAKQWDIVKQLQSEVRGWREKHAEMMLKMDKLEKDGF